MPSLTRRRFGLLAAFAVPAAVVATLAPGTRAVATAGNTAAALCHGWMTRSEARALEGLPPIEPLVRAASRAAERHSIPESSHAPALDRSTR